MRKLILLVLPLILLTTSCIFRLGPPPEGGWNNPTPAAFRLKADYDTVWWAAVDTLDYMGYVIVQMRKYDGYLATDRLEEYERRTRVRVRITELEDSVLVEIDASGEILSDSSEESGVAKWVSVGGGRAGDEVMWGIEERAGATALPPREITPDPVTEPADPAGQAARQPSALYAGQPFHSIQGTSE